jgi:O-antigen ligase
MSAWTPRTASRPRLQRFAASDGAGRLNIRLDVRVAAWAMGLLCVLVLEGAAIAQSYIWAAPLLCLAFVAVATEIPVVWCVGLALVVRVLTSQAVSSPHAQYSGSLNLSGLIAVAFILLAAGLILRRRRGVRATMLAALALCFWTALALKTHGESSLTIREGVREASMIALAVIVVNGRGALAAPVATRVVQLAGIGAAVLAIYQLATHTGLNVGGNIRSDGTFTHPNGAAMYFAIAVTASLWRYLESGRHKSDALFVAVYGAATITTFSVSGLASLLVMLLAFGALRPGALRLKLGSCAVAALIVIAFVASPTGAKRIENESSTSIASAETRGTANTSLAWRFYKWRTLIPEWEQAPVLGKGLGSTVTTEGTSENSTAGKQPHNEYVRYLVETGALGLICVLVAVSVLIGTLARQRRRSGGFGAATLGIAVVAGCLFNALGDNTLLYSTTGYAAALVVAGALVSPRPSVEPRSSGASS